MDTVKFEKKNVKIVAHRGLSGIETENTNAAFIAAANRSYFGIETDIRVTRDGRFAVSHDSTLERVGGLDVSICDRKLDELSELRLLDKDGARDRSDLRVTCLENYLKICKRYSKHAVLEIKNVMTDEQIDAVIATVAEYDYLDSLTFISFYYDNLTAIRRRLPKQSVQFLFSKPTDEIIDRLIADRIDVDIHHAALTAELIERFHAAGLTVNCYTVDNPERGEELALMGIDMITSNILE